MSDLSGFLEAPKNAIVTLFCHLQALFVNNKTTNKATFRKVGKIQNLYRHAKTGTYYSLIKRSGKQFRRSLKTNDLQLAKIRLNELQRGISKLTNSSDSKLPFNLVFVVVFCFFMVFP